MKRRKSTFSYSRPQSVCPLESQEIQSSPPSPSPERDFSRTSRVVVPKALKSSGELRARGGRECYQGTRGKSVKSIRSFWACGLSCPLLTVSLLFAPEKANKEKVFPSPDGDCKGEAKEQSRKKYTRNRSAKILPASRGKSHLSSQLWYIPHDKDLLSVFPSVES